MAYAIGVDYGTQSGRVVLLDLQSGDEVSAAVVVYEHGVIDTTLPTTGESLPPDWALQHPGDYIKVLEQGIPHVLRLAGTDGSDVVGMGIDFTSCTVLPVDERGTPLCTLDAWGGRKHAWPKLWKHHAAQPIADRINEIAVKRGESFLSRYGGKISSEWYFPKLLEVFEQDREVYNATARFLEATDWIVWYLTGIECRNSCTAGYKATWSQDEGGVPGEEFFKAVNDEFVSPSEKLGDSFFPLGTRAGYLRHEVAETVGLYDSVAVAVGNVDAMVAAPSVGLDGPGSLVMVMGTSICHLAVSEEEIRMPGITGVVRDGVLPGFFGYEAGQAAVGDMFEWFVSRMVPQQYFSAAKAEKKSIYTHLEELATSQEPGENGLIAVDWWNGNRSILADADLSGIFIGFTLQTSVEDMYRALLESTAYGTRRIINNFVDHGVSITELIACGGIAQKSPLLMQIYADVCGLPVSVRNSDEIPARGAAMFGAVAAGAGGGGFDNIRDASAALKAPLLKTYHPNEKNHKIYNQLLELYQQVHDFFGVKNGDLLHKLKNVRIQSKTQQHVEDFV